MLIFSASSCTESPDNFLTKLERSKFLFARRHCKGLGAKFYYFDNRRMKCLEKIGPSECPKIPELANFMKKEKSKNNFKTFGECREKCESTGNFLYILSYL